MSKIPLLLALLASSLLQGCSGSRIVHGERSIEHPVRRLAAEPGRDLTADEILRELRGQTELGIEILGVQDSVELLQRLELPSVAAGSREGLESLRAEGIDAWMVLEIGPPRNSGAGPQRVAVRITSTHDPEQGIEFTFHNAWGGVPGSPADHAMSRSNDQVIRLVVEEIVEQLAGLGSPAEVAS